VYRAIKRGARQDAFTSYVLPLLAHTNICIQTQATVTQLIFTPSPAPVETMPRTVSGVKYTQGGVEKTVTARLEVILSAGVYGTAKILLLSGIGPRDHLNEVGINVVKDLPVATSFTARPVALTLCTGNYNFDPRTPIAPYMTSAILDPTTPLGQQALQQWLVDGTGGLGIGSASILGSPITSPNEPAPNYLVHWSDALPPLSGSVDQRCIPAAFQNFPPVTELPGATSAFCALTKPKSRAQIKLYSANPAVPLYFAPNYFSEQEDVDDLVKCLKLVRGQTGVDPIPPSGIYGVSGDPSSYPISNFRPFRGIEFFPGVGIGAGIEGPTELETYVRTCSHSAYHVFGSTPIGNDHVSSVVDPQLIVHGFTNLRIADAGVIIAISSGPYATTHMIGERCADFIRKRYLL